MKAQSHIADAKRLLDSSRPYDAVPALKVATAALIERGESDNLALEILSLAMPLDTEGRGVAFNLAVDLATLPLPKSSGFAFSGICGKHYNPSPPRNTRAMLQRAKTYLPNLSQADFILAAIKYIDGFSFFENPFLTIKKHWDSLTPDKRMKRLSWNAKDRVELIEKERQAWQTNQAT